MSTTRASSAPRPARPAPPPRPRGRDRPRITHQPRGGEPADVDAELQGARRDHPEQVSVEETALDPPALLRQVARAVGADTSGQRGCVLLQRGAGVPLPGPGDLTLLRA